MNCILEKCILVAGKDQEQYFLLIPNDSINEKWRYWKFASWHSGEHKFENLHHYFKDVLEFCENQSLEDN
ncbi:hypothetical protein SAMN05880574_11649 [Chryseobacterium sp. RU37D]|uniref:hypothetical protein n=1 Tax=Chryseobacterium sp. RU37D TaxID=1907397 RepID=UPI000956B01E|nr:hypothetical protein [Chryseobacterium sp. RU37D]SIQ55936.1 hypothetical protein SAMN05880574_11649 [Chryseobacterium sp. RU37D]